ncbi:uncharacterized protein PITG_22903 [Phytophthora infestans T30-4]|uniref:Secreted RxLR effector peptide protein n=2 Tax=Phytophthora infestans TaxID=4787 RepID=D0NDX5_PHYIT|nr:uncharacterized protein PITG_22903 [Phytophthora infestans T30-4]EEY56420.1 conserved hypothetical protein [Phytophthora infestans T30-4]KAF4035993.1 hypothetical protein GN244_ATG11991 [Phytophthora infestans]|eukprot:XP_002902494.1 conserved hypothetical protein [Phytophthora infestans T30-4]
MTTAPRSGASAAPWPLALLFTQSPILCCTLSRSLFISGVVMSAPTSFGNSVATSAAFPQLLERLLGHQLSFFSLSSSRFTADTTLACNRRLPQDEKLPIARSWSRTPPSALDKLQIPHRRDLLQLEQLLVYHKRGRRRSQLLLQLERLLAHRMRDLDHAHLLL